MDNNPVDSNIEKKEAVPLGGALSDALDRLEVRAGKIGMNSPEQARALLLGIDDALAQIELLEGKISKKTAEGQFDGILGRIQKEGRAFLKDLGGAEALRTLREQHNPPEDHWWWYLDVLLDKQRKAGWRRNLFTLVGIAIGFAIVVLIYQLFLAPDPKTAALYSHEQSARDWMLNGELDKALVETEAGLQLDPANVPMLTLKGVIFEQQGKPDEAQQFYSQAETAAPSREEFLEVRGGAYLLVSNYEAALGDSAEILKINPQSATAYMLAGQTNELMQNYNQALDDYSKAFQLADEQNQPALAATARMRTGLVLQMMGQQLDPSATPIPTPIP